MTLRHLTRYCVAYTVWQLANGQIHVSQVSAGAFDKARGEPPGRPDDTAVFLMGAGGIPALDTADGWPVVGDYWYEEDETGNQSLVIATATIPNFSYSSAVADEPQDGHSWLTGLRVRGQGRVRIPNVSPRWALRTLPPWRSLLDVQRIRRRILNHHSVTFDAHSSATSDGTSALQWNHTVSSAGNPYIAVTGAVVGGSPTQTATYNAAAMTSRASANPNSTFRGEYFDMTTMPPATGTNQVQLAFDASRACVGIALSCTGVHQTAPRDKVVSASNAGSTTPAFTGAPSTGLVSPSSAAIGLSAAMGNAGSSLTDDTDNAWTMDEGTDGSQGIKNAGSDLHQWAGHRTGAGAIARSDTFAISAPWFIVGAAINATGIAHVQTANANGNSGTASITLTLTAGNAVIVHLMRDGDTTAATQGGSQDTLTSRVNTAASGVRCTQYTNFNVAGGSTTYSFTFTSTQWRIVVSEFNGLDTANTIDASGTLALQTSTSNHVVASGATTQANELIIAGWNGDTSGGTTFTSMNGDDAVAWVVPTNGSLLSGGVTEFVVAYQIVTATGTYGCTLVTADSFTANATLGTYKAAGGTAPRFILGTH